MKKKHGLGLGFLSEDTTTRSCDATTADEEDVLTEIMDAKLSMQNSDLDLRTQPDVVVESEEIGFAFGSGVPGLACKWCAKEFANPTGLVLHATTHNSSGQLLCALCFKGYNQRHNFIQHMKMLHSEVDSETIERELMRKNGEVLKRFPWRDDEEGKEERNSVNMRTKDFDSTLIFVCPLCDGIFKHKELMKTHTLVIHQLEGVYVFEEQPLPSDDEEEY